MKISQRPLYALSLLTTLPVRLDSSPSAGDTGRAAVWFPWVGLVIGLLVVLAREVLDLFTPPLVTAVICLAVWVVLTGGLHLDGLADCCDGLLHASNPQRRLEIMRDAHLGSFGATGLVLILLLKAAVFVSLPPGLSGGLAILLAASLARWLVLPAGRQPIARPGGMGADLAAGLTTPAILAGAALPVVLGMAGGWRGVLAFGLATALSYGLFVLARRRIGGVTGDVFGATIEIAETAVLLAFTIR